MKISYSQTTNNPKSKGFSLVEVIIALGIVALLLTGFLGVFGTAQKNIQRSISVKEANMLRDSLEVELETFRIGETYDNSFHKAFETIKNSTDEKTAVLIYQYKALPDDDNNDGILPPYTGKSGIPGKDYFTQSAVRVRGTNDTLITKELSAISTVGSVYAVKLTQLIKNTTNGNLELSKNPGTLRYIDAGVEKVANNYKDYNQAVIVFQAEFYRLPTNAAGYVTSNSWKFKKLGSPVATINLAVRR